tara:strand:- start:2179 stop:3354 length:1176 start_codon:yes stop_codon:yes gene_type:complete
MTIGIVLPNTPTQSETFILSKINLLQNNGYRIIVFGNKLNGSYHYEMINHPKICDSKIFQLLKVFLSFLRMLLFYPLIAKKFLKLEKTDGITLRTRWKNLYLNNHILRQQMDWIHFGFITMAVRRENIAATINAKMAISIRGYDISIYPLKYRGCYDRIWDKVDKVHSISKDLLKIAYKNGLKKNTYSTIINPAIDTNIFNIKYKKLNNIKNKKLKILTVARLHWKKGLDYTLEALGILNDRKIPFEYFLIGEGNAREQLLYTIDNLGLKEKVHLLGAIQHNQIKKYYLNSHIYLQFSIQEGFCNSVLEAQAMGLLTFVSNAEGLSENVINEKTGWVVPKRKPEILARKIISVINSDEKNLNQIRLNAMIRVKEEFNLVNHLKLYDEFYKH